MGSEYYKEWYSKNKDKKAEYMKSKITCECGSVVSRARIGSHRRTKKHLTRINNINSVLKQKEIKLSEKEAKILELENQIKILKK